MLLTPGTSNAVSFGLNTVLVRGILGEFNQERNRGGIWTLGRNSCQLHVAWNSNTKEQGLGTFSCPFRRVVKNNASAGQCRARGNPKTVRQAVYGRFTLSCSCLLTSSRPCRGRWSFQFGIQNKKGKCLGLTESLWEMYLLVHSGSANTANVTVSLSLLIFTFKKKKNKK